MTDFLKPLNGQYQQNEHALHQAMQAVFQQHFQQDIQDLIDYGSPHWASINVVEKFSKRDGLVVLRRKSTSDKVMRAIYACWSVMGSRRGLDFLTFVLKMLWGERWEIKRIFHSISQIESYPKAWQYHENSDSFLTSRIHLLLDETEDIKEAVEVVPVLRNLVPANVVLQVMHRAVDQVVPIHVACVARNLRIIDLT